MINCFPSYLLFSINISIISIFCVLNGIMDGMQKMKDKQTIFYSDETNNICNKIYENYFNKNGIEL